MKRLGLILIAARTSILSDCELDGFAGLLELNLKPLRGITGLGVVTTEFKIHHEFGKLMWLPEKGVFSTRMLRDDFGVFFERETMVVDG